MEFEVIKADLDIKARILKCQINSAVLETPILWLGYELRSPLRLWEGFYVDGIILNAYELLSHRAEINWYKSYSIQSYLGYHGPIMIDSGGFIFMRRNDISIDINELIDLYERSRPLIGVVLDYPLDPFSKQIENRSRWAKILENTRMMFSHNGSVPLLPIVHGHTMSEIAEACDALQELCDIEFLGIGSLVPLMKGIRGANISELTEPELKGSRRPLSTNKRYSSRHFVIDAIKYVRERFPDAFLHVFGVGGTTTIHLMLALGVDSIDSVGWRLKAGHVAKTDRVGAGVLCRMISGVRMRPAVPKPEEQERLRVLTRWYFRLQQDRTRALNRISAAVDVVFPEFWQMFPEITQATPRMVLQTYGTPGDLVRADTGAVTCLLRRVSRGGYVRKDAEYLQALASRTVGIRNLYAPVALQIRQALAQVDLIDQQIRELEPLIEQEFHAMGFAAEEFPIGGVTTIATIIAHLPSPQSTPSLKSLHAFVGWCPRDRQSGQYKSTRPRMAKGCPPLRWALYGLALGSMPHVETYKQYITRRKAEGKTGGHILVIIGRKLLDRIWAIARTKDVFLPAAPTLATNFKREELALHY